jgi:DNA-binding GntR family transcriptional regulator
MPVPASPSALERRLYRDDVYTQLRAWIVEGTLEPEEKLRDTDLATQLKVSRTPVREALRRLEDEGLVETKQNAWTRVAALDLRLPERIYPILRALEPLALEAALPWITGADLEQMRVLSANVRHALETGDAKRAALEDTALHGAWVAACGNPELLSIIAALKTQHIRLEIHYWRGGTRALESVIEHERVIAALEAGDAKRARRELEAHWTRALSRWVEP